MRPIVVLLFVFIGCAAFAQDGEKAKRKALTESKNLTWEGNKQLSEDKFPEAEVDYRRAIAKSDENTAARYNLGNALYNNETYSEAFGRFKQAGELADNKSEKHRAYHNMGNVFMKRKDYQKAVEAYKEALRNDPTDEETRYNLALAKEMLKKEQEENDQNQDNKDENEDKKDENEDKKEGDNEDENKDKDEKDEGDKGDQGDEEEEQKDENKEGDGDQKKEQEKKPEPGDQDEQQQPQQRRPDQLSKQQVQNLLEAMQNEEKKVQEKMDAKKVQGVKVKTEKDW